MTDQLTYQSPVKSTRCHFTVSGSRFIANLIPVVSEEAVSTALALIRAEFPEATHHTYAFRIGAGGALIERNSDDREPSGTAGSPMLQVLQGGNISDALIVATRYFGGTKLGLPLGEAIVFFNRALGEEFAYRCKQAGQLASKMRFLSAPWLALLEDDTW
ncbi:MAG: YigZ family protein, partial [Dethiobacteria bacterium]|nr:YigZ family protein [Dethiobacteria bacterium]